MWFMKRFLLTFLFVFAMPAGLSTAVWAVAERPTSWRYADWSSSGKLPAAEAEKEAVVYVLAARTGGLKGALAVHSWIVYKKAGNAPYVRYDKVGWGNPLRRNGYAADGRWYSNDPFVVARLKGEAAAAAIPRIEQAIADYPHSLRGGYRIWPGPNSNSFVAHVLREVPELGAVLPPNAVGRDYLSGGRIWSIDPDGRDFHFTLYGMAGFAAGVRSGIEIHLLGLVAGLDIARPALKIPGFGRIGM